MKKFILIVFFFCAANVLLAQNIAINTDASAAHASSILDVKSTTKGMLMPRLTSVQRVAIASPATGLMVFDTDTKTIWAYDGAAWKNLTSIPGSFSLPYLQTVNLASQAFKIINQGTGAAMEATSSNELGIGLSGNATGTYGWGLLASSNRPGANSIYAIADSGTVIKGENNYVGNTNTLMSLLNKGVGKTVTVQLANSSSTAANMQIAGNQLGEQLTIFQTNASNTQHAVSITNSGTGAGVFSTTTNGIGMSAVSNSNYAIKGVTNTSTGFAGVYGQNTGTQGNGVYGVSNNLGTIGVSGLSASGTGIRGESNTGTGILAYSGSGIGISSGSLSGTGIYANSLSGLALHVNGNLRITGGNTSPTNGAVLTSDASGNAVWKANRLAFKAISLNPNYTNLPSGQWRRLYFANEYYDLANNFTPYPVGTNPTATSSSFAPPLDGVYHLECNVLIALPRDETAKCSIRFRLDRGGVISTLQDYPGVMPYQIDFFDYKYGYLKISGDFLLFNADKVFVEVFQSSDAQTAGTVFDNVDQYFAGHLAIPY